MQLVTKSELSRMAGVSPAAINDAIKNEKLRLVGEGRKSKIDLHDSLTEKYLKNSNRQRQKKKESTEQSSLPNNIPPDDDIPPDDENISFKARKEKEQWIKLKLANEEKMKNLIPVGMVQRMFGEMNQVFYESLHILGERLSPLLCGRCKVDDPETILDVQKLIDEDVFRTIESLKQISLERVQTFDDESY